MLQFTVWPAVPEKGWPHRRLMEYVPARYDFWYGFHRLVKELPDVPTL